MDLYCTDAEHPLNNTDNHGTCRIRIHANQVYCDSAIRPLFVHHIPLDDNQKHIYDYTCYAYIHLDSFGNKACEGIEYPLISTLLWNK